MKCVALIFFISLAAFGCGGKENSPRADGSMGGGLGGSGGSGGSGGYGGGNNGDASALDAGADDTNDAGSDSSGPPGCGVGSLCRSLRAAYSEAIMRAKSCTGGDETCAVTAPGSLGCVGCPVWVTDRTELDALTARFTADGCDACFFGSPMGDRCHPVVCPDLGFPMCTAGPSGLGTCVDRPKDRTCPADIETGTPCTREKDDYCLGDDNVCTCDLTEMTWLC